MVQRVLAVLIFAGLAAPALAGLAGLEFNVGAPVEGWSGGGRDQINPPGGPGPGGSEGFGGPGGFEGLGGSEGFGSPAGLGGHGGLGSLGGPAALPAFFTSVSGGPSDSPGVLFSSSDGSAAFLGSGVLLRIGDDKYRTTLQLTFPGARTVAPVGEGVLSHKTNYYLGADPANWLTGAANYRQVVYRGLYPAIDLAFYHSSEGLKYDWVVAAGADPEVIRERYEGGAVALDLEGGLIVTTAMGAELREAPPRAFQGSSEVEVAFRLEGDTLSYALGPYDPALPLVIDPLVYSTFVGGEDWEGGTGIVLDEYGNGYVTGYTGSQVFPTTEGALAQSHQGGDYDAFVLKLTSDGSRLAYATFVGGGGRDWAHDIAMGPEGDLFVVGETFSEDFPITPEAYDPQLNGSNDAFVFRLSLASGELVYATYLGGEDYEAGQAVVVDGQGQAYVTGSTGSADFPVLPGNASYQGGQDLFLAKLAPDGRELVYATLMGGDRNEVGLDIGVDVNGSAYVTGSTKSADFPVTEGAYNTHHEGGREVLVVKVNQTGEGLAFSTLVGGGGDEAGEALVLDGNGRVHVTGWTDSEGFPTTTGAYSQTPRGGREVFLFGLSDNGSALEFSTLVGGQGDEQGQALALDGQGHIFVTGYSESPDFPTTDNAFQRSSKGAMEVVFFRLSGNASNLTYATYLGGQQNDQALALALDNEGIAYLTGDTTSQDFPTTPGGNDTSANGYSEVFVTRLDPSLNPIARIISIDPMPATEGDLIAFVGSGSDAEGQITGYQWRSDLDGLLATSAAFTTSTLSPGDHSLFLRVQDDYGDWSEPAEASLHVNARPTATINQVSNVTANEGDPLSFQGGGSDWDGAVVGYRWRSSRDGLLSGQAAFTTSELSPGDHTIYFAVQDNEGGWSLEDKVKVHINGRPSALIEADQPEPFHQGQSLRFSGSGADLEGYIIGYRWWLDGRQLANATPVLALANLTPGDHLLNLSVQDNRSAWSPAYSRLVHINGLPEARIISISPSSPTQGHSVTLRAEASDADGWVVLYEWRSDRDGFLGSGPTLHTSGLSVGNHTLSLKVMDDSGGWSEVAMANLVVEPAAAGPSVWPLALAVLLGLTGAGFIISRRRHRLRQPRPRRPHPEPALEPVAAAPAAAPAPTAAGAPAPTTAAAVAAAATEGSLEWTGERAEPAPEESTWARGSSSRREAPSEAPAATAAAAAVGEVAAAAAPAEGETKGPAPASEPLVGLELIQPEAAAARPLPRSEAFEPAEPPESEEPMQPPAPAEPKPTESEPTQAEDLAWPEPDEPPLVPSKAEPRREPVAAAAAAAAAPAAAVAATVEGAAPAAGDAAAATAPIPAAATAEEDEAPSPAATAPTPAAATAEEDEAPSPAATAAETVTCPTCFEEVTLPEGGGEGQRPLRVTCKRCWDQFTVE